MRTNDVKVNQEYLHGNEKITIVKRILGRETKKRNMQSGVMFTGYKRMQKKFLLSNGKTVYANKLKENDHE